MCEHIISNIRLSYSLTDRASLQPKNDRFPEQSGRNSKIKPLSIGNRCLAVISNREQQDDNHGNKTVIDYITQTLD